MTCNSTALSACLFEIFFALGTVLHDETRLDWTSTSLLYKELKSGEMVKYEKCLALLPSFAAPAADTKLLGG